MPFLQPPRSLPVPLLAGLSVGIAGHTLVARKYHLICLQILLFPEGGELDTVPVRGREGRGSSGQRRHCSHRKRCFFDPLSFHPSTLRFLS